MKRKIRLSALVAVMVLMLALLIGGLYGYFDDTEDGQHWQRLHCWDSGLGDVGCRAQAQRGRTSW